MEISKILEYYIVVRKDVVNASKFILLLVFACFLMLHTTPIDRPFTVKTTKKISSI